MLACSLHEGASGEPLWYPALLTHKNILRRMLECVFVGLKPLVQLVEQERIEGALCKMNA